MKQPVAKPKIKTEMEREKKTPNQPNKDIKENLTATPHKNPNSTCIGLFP